MKTIRIEYYAQLREQSGCNEESISTSAATAHELYAELHRRHGFSMQARQVRVAVNDRFGDWQQPLADGDMVVFIPPVAGG